MSDSGLPYHAIPAPPEGVRGAAVMARLVDGLGFRLRWATEGLRPQDLDFRPGPDSMTLRELLHHVGRLVGWVDQHLGGPPLADLPPDCEAQRAAALGRLAALRERLLALPDERLRLLTITGKEGTAALPFWNMVNGPLADALTHVGQINAWRRLSGNPAPRADVFRGRPPG